MFHDLSFNLRPLLPAWAIAGLAAALCLLLIHGSRQLLNKKVPHRWVTILGVLRAFAIAVLVLCLLQPMVSYTRSTEIAPDLLVMIDTSQSMGIKASEDGRTRLDVARESFSRTALLDRLKERFNIH